jgi:hypothetical protein
MSALTRLEHFRQGQRHRRITLLTPSEPLGRSAIRPEEMGWAMTPKSFVEMVRQVASPPQHSLVTVTGHLRLNQRRDCTTSG